MAIDIRAPFIFWISFYILNRKQIVKCDNLKSFSFSVLSGEPQGSHLAPILFLLFINNLKLLNSRKLLFADDMKLFRLLKNNHDALLLQKDLNILRIGAILINFHCLNLKKM